MDKQTTKSKYNNLSEIVEASVEGWYLFITTGLTSTFYQNAIKYLNSRDASMITLMHFYLNTFTSYERELLLKDSDHFLIYADGFIRELIPYGKRDIEFFSASKKVFSRAMRKILSPDKKKIPDEISYCNRRDFMRAAIKLTSSVDEMIRCWDLYKEYLFRHAPLDPKNSQSILSIA